jgi:hypothetical protein
VTLLYGVAAVALLWWFLSNFAHTNPAILAKFLKVIGGIVALGVAGLLAVRGRIDLALLIGSLGAWLLGWSRINLPSFGSRDQRSSGSTSRVRSSLIEMTLDHDTGEMEGSVLAGAWTGRKLASLDETGLSGLLAECHASDPDGVRLLEAYLDRRFPQWREDTRNEEEPRSDTQPSSNVMTPEEACQILGLQPGARRDDIRQAYRALMKKLHPDQGGSTYLAARVNQAKDILLSRHDR